MSVYIPKAIVLAHPAACTTLNSRSNQNAFIGVSARPTHDNISISKQIKKVGLRPN